MLAYLHKYHGCILLVGEGDFSFSLSLCKQLPQVSLTATCIEDDTPKKYKYAQQNISQLKEGGGNVIFGVDATNIESCELLKGKQFDVVIFNFPHTGRKARIQDNRKLVRDFFISASQCLATDGQVLITLCNGQGGTPADNPQREWFNSWQVVAMASFADLILTNIEEFVAQDFPEYSCTGYRGQGKGFNTKAAITHIFEKCPIMQEPVPTPIVLHHQKDGYDRTFLCPDELSAFMKRNLLQDTTSPICEVYHRISERCKSMFNGILVEESKECDWINEVNEECIQLFVFTLKEHHLEDANNTDKDACTTNMCNESDTNAIQRKDTIEANNKSAPADIPCNCSTTVDAKSCQHFENSKTCSGCNHQDAHFILSPSIKHCSLCQSDHGGETAKVLVGPVFRRCVIGPELFPISHELQLFLPEQSCKRPTKEIVSSIISLVSPEIEIKLEPLSIDSEMPSEYLNQEGLELLKKDEGQEITPEILNRLSELGLANQKEAPSVSGPPDLRGTPSASKHHLMQRNIWDAPSVSGPPDLRGIPSASKHHLMQRNIWTASIRQQCMESNFCGTYKEVFDVITISLDTKVYEVGIIGRITSTKNLESKIVIILKIDLLTMLCYNIDDVRLMWFNNALLKRTSTHVPEISRYVCYSKYPPCYVRDLSFWVSSEASFPETLFLSIVRSLCVDYIKSVNLIDVYKNQATQRHSLCYRFVYQSLTRALCRSKVNKIHEDLGSRLESLLGIQLRS